jgi:hypothetical protein
VCESVPLRHSFGNPNPDFFQMRQQIRKAFVDPVGSSLHEFVLAKAAGKQAHAVVLFWPGVA